MTAEVPSKAAVASFRAPLSDRSNYHRGGTEAAGAARKVLSAREATNHKLGYGYVCTASKEKVLQSPHQRARAESAVHQPTYKSPRLKRSPAPKPSVALRPQSGGVPASSPELPSPQLAPLVDGPVGAAHAAARAAPCNHNKVPHAMILQMHAAHRRRALADHQAAQMAARAGSPRHVGAAGPRPPPAAAAVAPDHQRPAAATTGDGLTSTYAARGGGGTTACTTHAYHNATVAKQDSGKAGLGRRSQAPPKHGADLRARKYATVTAAQDATRPLPAQRGAAWVR